MPLIKKPLPAFTGAISQPDPIWVTPTGIVSAGNENISITVPLQATDPFNSNLIYTLKSGQLPGFHNLFGNMVILLHADEPEASPITVNAVTSTGILLENTMVITNTESKFGLGCIDNQNKEGYINLGQPSILGLSNNDFSIHGWFNRKANPVAIYELFSNNQLPSNVVSIRVYLNNTSVPVYTIVTSNMTNYELVGLQPVLLNTWTHIAMVKRNATMYAFVDGILQGSVIMDSLLLRFDADNDLFLCASGELGKPVGSLNYNRFNGRVDEFVIELSARWSSNFTPPIAQFNSISSSGSADPHFSNVSLLLQASSSNIGDTLFSDNSSKNKTITNHNSSTVTNTDSKFGGKSFQFNGVNQFLSIPQDNDFVFVPGEDYTFEFWIKITGISAAALALGDYAGITGVISLYDSSFSFNAANQMAPFSTSARVWALSATPRNNQWFHYALVNHNNTRKLFYDGILQDSVVDTTAGLALNSNNFLYIGSGSNYSQTTNGLPNAYYYMTGFMDQIRITKGIARYTANFIPPSAAFPSLMTSSVSVPGVSLGINGILTGNVGSYLGVTGSDLYNFTATATSSLTRISTDRNFDITVFDPNLNTNWVSTWNGNAVQHIITYPNTVQFNASTPNNVWLIWNNP